MVSRPQGRHLGTFQEVFEDPLRSNIRWDDLEALLRHLGAKISEGRGSRVRVTLHGEDAVFHRPHPQKECDKGALKSFRRFLVQAGYEEDDKSADASQL